MIDIIATCPLGHTCEEARDGKLYRCRWYKSLSGYDPVTGKEYESEYDCAIPWSLTATLEAARTNRGQTQAIEDLRNHVVDGNDKLEQAYHARLQRQ